MQDLKEAKQASNAEAIATLKKQAREAIQALKEQVGNTESTLTRQAAEIRRDTVDVFEKLAAPYMAAQSRINEAVRRRDEQVRLIEGIRVDVTRNIDELLQLMRRLDREIEPPGDALSIISKATAARSNLLSATADLEGCFMAALRAVYQAGRLVPAKAESTVVISAAPLLFSAATADQAQPVVVQAEVAAGIADLLASFRTNPSSLKAQPEQTIKIIKKLAAVVPDGTDPAPQVDAVTALIKTIETIKTGVNGAQIGGVRVGALPESVEEKIEKLIKFWPVPKLYADTVPALVGKPADNKKKVDSFIAYLTDLHDRGRAIYESGMLSDLCLLREGVSIRSPIGYFGLIFGEGEDKNPFFKPLVTHVDKLGLYFLHEDAKPSRRLKFFPKKDQDREISQLLESTLASINTIFNLVFLEIIIYRHF